MGDTSWLEPLPTDEPLAAADEWGTAMALSCAVNLSVGEKLAYIPDSGMHKSVDRNTLILVGDRTGGDGLRCLEEIQQRGPGDEDSCNMWTVEFWARLTSRARGLLFLFSRSSVDFMLKHSTDTSTFSLGRRQGHLKQFHWFYVALRSDLFTHDLRLNGDTVLETSQIFQAAADEELTFGPALGFRITEGKIWAVFRTNEQLVEHQRQPLFTHTQEEERTDVCGFGQ